MRSRLRAVSPGIAVGERRALADRTIDLRLHGTFVEGRGQRSLRNGLRPVSGRYALRLPATSRRILGSSAVVWLLVARPLARGQDLLVSVEVEERASSAPVGVRPPLSPSP